jgi:LemA protein
MHSAWQRLQGTLDDLAGAAVPPSLALLWQHHAVLVQDKQRDYNASVLAYNQAIQQFPAWLLAWIFSFRAAQPS